MNYQGNLETKKATIFVPTGLGNIIKIQVRELEVIRRQWAQYPGAVVARFKAPRKRNWSSYTGGYKPFLVVLKGWNHPEPLSPWKTVSENNDATLQQARYPSCSDEWNNDFDKWFDDYLASNPKVKVLGDYRFTKGCNSHDTTYKAEFDNHQIASVQTQLRNAGVPKDLAQEVAELCIAKSANWACGVLNQNDFYATVIGGRKSPECIYINEKIIEPEDFFSKAT